MFASILQRIVQAVFVMFCMTIVVFIGMNLIGNPIDLLISPSAPPAERARLIAEFGLDQPIWVQYWRFLGGLVQLDLGTSYIFNEPALRVIMQRFPATMELALAATFLSVLIGVPLGLYAGLRPYSTFSRFIMTGSILGFSLPTFWVGMMLILVFSVQLGWLPSGGRGDTVTLLGVKWSFLTWDGLSHMLLPALNLALFKASLILRLTRAGVAEVLPQDYVRLAHAKGLSARRVVFVHVLKNVMIPVVTVVGLEFGSVIAFSVVTETIFSWPGMGKLIIDSINNLDRPIIVAYLMIIVLLFVTINLVVDILYTVLDPRVQFSKARTS